MKYLNCFEKTSRWRFGGFRLFFSSKCPWPVVPSPCHEIPQNSHSRDMERGKKGKEDKGLKKKICGGDLLHWLDFWTGLSFAKVEWLAWNYHRSEHKSQSCTLRIEDSPECRENSSICCLLTSITDLHSSAYRHKRFRGVLEKWAQTSHK